MAALKKDALKVGLTKSAAAETVKKDEAPKAVKKAEAPKAEAEKKAEAPKAAEKKAAPEAKKAPAAKKTPAKKAEPKASVVIEYAGSQIMAKDVLDAATQAYQAAHKGVTIKTIEVYVKPEENVAYYVVNGEGSEDYKVSL